MDEKLFNFLLHVNLFSRFVGHRFDRLNGLSYMCMCVYLTFRTDDDFQKKPLIRGVSFLSKFQQKNPL